MTGATCSSCDRKPLIDKLYRIFALCLLLGACGVCTAADEDPYLELLNEESSKVGDDTADTTGDGKLRPKLNATKSAKLAETQEEFEEILRGSHVGTYSFYHKLPERTREEIYADYKSGTEMEDLRRKIIDRFLHP
ncbi:hypothetical protein [Thiosocius teredinicola]|uniref:hypothetical protein n=1 Tax=Thiosocius teredinicola TaxID=1973002 RepID=UPI0009914B25